VVKPTRRLGKIPPGYEMDGRSKSGSSQISVHLARHGQYENCDWGASYQRKTWFRVDGNPTYNSLGWYVLDLAERRASYDTEEPMPDPQGACGSGEFGTGVAAKDAHARFEGETGADRSLTDLARWYRTKQPRTRLSYPINVLRAGKNLTLHATGSEDNESYTLSGTVTIKFIRKHG